MPKGILGRKVGMTQVFTEDGRLVPVTIEAHLPLSVKTKETDGYEAIQVGLGEKRES